MPTYDFKNTQTGEVWEERMSISERDEILKTIPHIAPVLTTPKIDTGVDGLRKPDDSFRDILRNIKKKHSSKKNTMNQNADF